MSRKKIDLEAQHLGIINNQGLLTECTAISDKRLTAFICLNDIQYTQTRPVHCILARIDYLHIEKLIRAESEGEKVI